MVFLVLLACATVQVGVLQAFSKRGTARRWSVAELALGAVSAPLALLGWAVLSGGWGTAAKAVGLVGLWLLLFSRFSQLIMGTPTGDHTVEGVLVELEGLFAGVGDDESAAVVRERREGLAAASTGEEAERALRAIDGLAEPGNGRFTDRFTGTPEVDRRLSELWPVLGVLAERRLPRPRV
jgi:hypothetical protein